MTRIAPALILLVLAPGAPASAATGETAALAGSRSEVEIGLAGGLPVRWLSCSADCGGPGSLRQKLLAARGGNRLEWVVPGDAAATKTLNALGYMVTREAEGLVLTSTAMVEGRRLVHRYRIDEDGYRLHARLDVPAGAALRLTTGADFVPEPLPGFGAIYSRVRAVTVGEAGQTTLDDDEPGTADVRLTGPEWTGLRNRFWALVFRADGAGSASAGDASPNRPNLTWTPARGGTSSLVFYGGPVEWTRLERADPVLGEMLFAALWDWLRALCFAMLWLLNRIMGIVGSAGWSVVLLSLCVKILMLPLTRIADRWQDDVNRTASLLKPQLDAIRREYRGEEAHRRTLAVYAEHGVPIMYPLKSLAGFLIQIPVFIAAFDMLGENFALNQAGFLWAEDLAKPDRWLALPFALPFFGASLNLLPFLMTGVTLLASLLQTETSLTPDLMQRQRLRLYLLATAFFVLFYTFPAGMVLYWTTNNVLHLITVMLTGRHRFRTA